MRNIMNLLELAWVDSSASGIAAKKYRGEEDVFIHFSNIPKLGINPLKKDVFGEKEITHNDPPGIYFYSMDFALRYGRWDQFAMDFPYYYIVRAKNVEGTIVLPDMTREQALAIANRNGWGETLKAAFEHDFVRNGMLKKNQMSEDLWGYPGAIFWGVADWLVNGEFDHNAEMGEYHIEGMTWSRLFKGISWMLDPGLGIINHNEPQQMLVFKLSSLDILEFGENKDLHNEIAAELIQTIKRRLGAATVASDGATKTISSDIATVKVTFQNLGCTVEVQPKFSPSDNNDPFTYRFDRFKETTLSEIMRSINGALDTSERLHGKHRESEIRKFYGEAIVAAADKLGLETSGKWGDQIDWNSPSYSGLHIECAVKDTGEENNWVGSVRLVYDFYTAGKIVIERGTAKGFETIRTITLPADPQSKFSKDELVKEFVALLSKLK